jgi:cytochrome c oxidase subunit 3
MTAPGSASLRWPRPAADLNPAERDDVVQLGVWMFLATVVMLFAAFTSAYIVRRSASDWSPVELPPILWANTAVLVASSLALEVGRRARARLRGPIAARAWIIAAAALGVLFLTGQVAVWRDLTARGLYLPSGPYSAFVYILTGLHGAHVAAGVTLLLVAAWRTWRAGLGLWSDAPPTVLNAAATFWHFLAVLWVYLFALVTLF